MTNYIIATIIGCSVLVSCARQGEFPAEEVLRRSSIANRGLVSAHLNLEANFTNGELSGVLNAEGGIQQGGTQMDMSIFSSGQSPTLQWSAQGQLIVVSQNEVYAKLINIQTTPLHPMLASPSFPSMLNVWYRLPPTPGVTTSQSITPDPHFLRMQAEVVRVVKDKGVQSLNGRDTYRYDVEVDAKKLRDFMIQISQNEGDATNQEALLQQLSAYKASGTIWIDAETFLLTQADWAISSFNESDNSNLNIHMELSSFDQPINIGAPADAKPFPQVPLLPPAEAVIMQEF